VVVGMGIVEIVGVESWATGGRASGRKEGVIVVAELSRCVKSSGGCLTLLMGQSNTATGEGAAATDGCDT
jgi:hypothetical protein